GPEFEDPMDPVHRPRLPQPGELQDRDLLPLRRPRPLPTLKPEEPFFLCGPPPFMESMQSMLTSLAVRSERIKRESFGYTRTIGGAAMEGPPPLQGTVEFARSGKVCVVPPGKTLLEVAEAHGVGIPSGC